MSWLPGSAKERKLVGDVLENPIISALVGSLVKSRDQKLSLPELRQRAEQLLRDAEVPSKLDEGVIRLHLLIGWKVKRLSKKWMACIA